MACATQMKGFPSVRLPSSQPGGLPVEVTLLSQLGHGAGDRLHADASARQRQHTAFNDDLGEASARLASPDIAAGEVTSLFSFTVGPGGHPFHRHAGHRIFTAVAGSGGALLRFCDVADAVMAANPDDFVAGIRQVEIPPDALFTARFAGGIWHQFLPGQRGARHLALFALSCHSNELGGSLTRQVRDKVRQGEASIAMLTELLPTQVQARLDAHDSRGAAQHTVALSLGAASETWSRLLCDAVRQRLGRLRARLSAWMNMPGFVGQIFPRFVVVAWPLHETPGLLTSALTRVHHRDLYRVQLHDSALARLGAQALLAEVLESFLQHPARGISALMWLRNQLVRPLGLRRSPLGCPVSSLLSTETPVRFAGRYPALAQACPAGNREATVLLGADDRHLRFRSCVQVRIVGHAQVEVVFGTQVQCHNLFGHLYLRTIDAVHRRYVAPTMLRAALEATLARHRAQALAQLSAA